MHTQRLQLAQLKNAPDEQKLMVSARTDFARVTMNRRDVCGCGVSTYPGNLRARGQGHHHTSHRVPHMRCSRVEECV